MSNLYRVYPTLYEGRGCVQAQTVYAIDRVPPSLASTIKCARRDSSDPLYYSNGQTFNRLTLSNSSCCYGPGDDSVTFNNLSQWISYAMSNGYSLASMEMLTKLNPFKDIYILGP
jgi:hypothetical protein